MTGARHRLSRHAADQPRLSHRPPRRPTRGAANDTPTPPAASTRNATRQVEGSAGTNRGSTHAPHRGTVRGMKPIIIVALWAIVGWNAGAWAQAILGIPAVVGILAGIAIGAAFAADARRRMFAAADRVPQGAVLTSSFEGAPALDRAA